MSKQGGNNRGGGARKGGEQKAGRGQGRNRREAPPTQRAQPSTSSRDSFVPAPLQTTNVWTNRQKKREEEEAKAASQPSSSQEARGQVAPPNPAPVLEASEAVQTPAMSYAQAAGSQRGHPGSSQRPSEPSNAPSSSSSQDPSATHQEATSESSQEVETSDQASEAVLASLDQEVDVQEVPSDAPTSTLLESSEAVPKPAKTYAAVANSAARSQGRHPGSSQRPSGPSDAPSSSSSQDPSATRQEEISESSERPPGSSSVHRDVQNPPESSQQVATASTAPEVQGSQEEHSQEQELSSIQRSSNEPRPSGAQEADKPPKVEPRKQQVAKKGKKLAKPKIDPTNTVLWYQGPPPPNPVDPSTSQSDEEPRDPSIERRLYFTPQLSLDDDEYLSCEDCEEVETEVSRSPEAPEPVPDARESPEAPEPAPEAQESPDAPESAPDAQESLDAPEPAPEAQESPETPQDSEADPMPPVSSRNVEAIGRSSSLDENVTETSEAEKSDVPSYSTPSDSDSYDLNTTKALPKPRESEDKKIELLANHFRLTKDENVLIYCYSIKFEPIPMPYQKCDVICKLQELHFKENEVLMAYDGESSGYTTRPLSEVFGTDTFGVDMGDDKHFEVSLKYEGPLGWTDSMPHAFNSILLSGLPTRRLLSGCLTKTERDTFNIPLDGARVGGTRNMEHVYNQSVLEIQEKRKFVVVDIGVDVYYKALGLDEMRRLMPGLSELSRIITGLWVTVNRSEEAPWHGKIEGLAYRGRILVRANVYNHIRQPTECTLYPHQPFLRDAFNTARPIIEFGAKIPQDLRQLIGKVMEKEYGTKNTHPSQFGLSVGSEMTEVEGRVLPAPVICYKGKPLIRDRGVWSSRNLEFVQAQNAKNVLVIVVTDRRVNAELLVKRLLGKARTLGLIVTLGSPDIVCTHPSRLEKDKDLNDICKNNPPPLILMLLNTVREVIVDPKFFEFHYGIPTLSFKTKFQNEKASDLYLSDWCHRINAKMGGVNWIVDLGSVTKMFESESVMFVGAYLARGQRENRKTPTITAIVGSLDQQLHRYYTSIAMQKRDEDGMLAIGQMVKQLLNKYAEKNEHRPQHIVMYRSGVSGTEKDTVFDKEVEEIREACKSLSEVDYKPTITYILVQTNHLTRFFQKKEEEADEDIPPGTVVDSTVTQPDEFYLCSHKKPNGTTRPTKYRVHRNEHDLSSYNVHKLTYDLCYAATDKTRPTRMPAPAHYAEMAVERSWQYLRDEDLGDEQFRFTPIWSKVIDEMFFL